MQALFIWKTIIVLALAILVFILSLLVIFADNALSNVWLVLHLAVHSAKTDIGYCMETVSEHARFSTMKQHSMVITNAYTVRILIATLALNCLSNYHQAEMFFQSANNVSLVTS